MELLFLLGDDVALLVALAIGVVGAVLFVRWMLEELGKLARRPEEQRRLAEAERNAIIREERQRVADEALARAREEEEEDRKTKLRSCRHEWLPVTDERHPDDGTSWRCSRCEVIASHEERALDSSLHAARRDVEQSTQRVREAAQRASAVHDDMRAFTEGLRFDQAAFDRQQERKHLERVKENRDLVGAPLSDEDAARVAHHEESGERILTNRERLVEAARRGVPKIEEAGVGSASPVTGGLVGVHSVGHAGGGKSFIAVNLATAIAETTGRDTALVALDDMSDVHDYFGLEARTDIQDLLALGDDPDHDRIRAIGDRAAPRIWAYAPRIDPTAESPTPEAVAALLAGLRDDFSFVVLDGTGDFSDVMLDCLRASDISLLVLDGLSDAGLRHTVQSLSPMASAGVPIERMRVVVNRHEADGIAPEAASNFLQVQIGGIIPRSSLASSSREEATPLVLGHSGSDIAAAFRELAATVLRELPASSVP